MKLYIYCVRDNKTSFMTPTVDQNDGSAMRNFSYAVEHTEGILSASRQDFDLYKLGSFDSDSGRIKPLTVPELIMSGSSVRDGINDEKDLTLMSREYQDKQDKELLDILYNPLKGADKGNEE